MVVLVHIDATVHRVADVSVSDHGVRVAAIIDVADDHARIGLVNGDVREQGLTVFYPDACRHGPCRAAAVVDGDALNQAA